MRDDVPPPPVEATPEAMDTAEPTPSGSEAAVTDAPEAAEPEVDELVDPPVDGAQLVELEEMGFPRARCYRALALGGGTTVEAAVNWLVEHGEDKDIDEPPPKVLKSTTVKKSRPKLSPEEAAAKAKELREETKKRKEREEREMNKARVIAMRESGKEMSKAKAELDEAERRRSLIERQRAKDEEARAREKIRFKMAQDKAERRAALGLPADESPEELAAEAAAKEKAAADRKKNNSFVPIKPAEKLIKLREQLRAMKQGHKDNDSEVFKTCCATLLKMLGNVAGKPEEDKFRKIKLSNAAIQKRIVTATNGVEFLTTCGFKPNGDGDGEDVLFMPKEDVNLELINGAGSVLQNALTNPMFGLL